MILDLNMLSSLSSGFLYYKSRENEFKALFKGVATSTLSTWFSEFSEHFPTFRTKNARGSDEAPMLVVSPQSENVQQTVLGDFEKRGTDGIAHDTYLVRESVEILIIARSADMARVYHVIARASIAIARRPLHRAGYHLIEYGGSDGLSLDEELSAEELGLYIRRLNVSGDHRVSIPIPAASEFNVPVYTGQDILVLSNDQSSNGVTGGVSTS